jgi:uridylate kinase
MIGDDWVPGKNVPFDPVASRHAEKIGLKVICAGGKNLENIKKILSGEDFTGTTIYS